MSPTPFSSNPESENNPSSGAGDELANILYQTLKTPEYDSKRIEAALKNFCDDFSLGKATSGDWFHPSLNTLSNYLQESADTNFSDLNDRFRSGRRIISYSISTHLGTNEAATVARQIVGDAFVHNMGSCLTEKKIRSTVHEHYIKLRKEHVDKLLLKTETQLEFMDLANKSSATSYLRSKEADSSRIANFEAAARKVRAQILQRDYLLVRHFPFLVSDAVNELKELAPEITVSFSNTLKKELFASFEEKFLNDLSQNEQKLLAEVDLCVNAIKSVFSSDISEQNG